MFQGNKIVYGPLLFYYLCQQINTLVNPVIAYYLPSIQMPRFRIESNFGTHLQGIGIVPCMRIGMCSGS